MCFWKKRGSEREDEGIAFWRGVLVAKEARQCTIMIGQ